MAIRASADADGTFGAMLERARRRAGISQDDLWRAYKDAGGRAGRDAFVGYLRGWTEPKISQYFITAKVLNELLEEAGEDFRLWILDPKHLSHKSYRVHNLQKAA